MDCFHKLCLSGTPQKIVRPVEIFEIKWSEVIGLTGNESVSWEVLLDVFKCFVREMRWRLISRTEHLNTSGILPSLSPSLSLSLSIYIYVCMYIIGIAMGSDLAPFLFQMAIWQHINNLKKENFISD